MMKEMDWQDIANRAFKTFVQAALAVVVASGSGYLEADVWEAAAVAGGAAVLSFLYNMASQWVDNY